MKIQLPCGHCILCDKCGDNEDICPYEMCGQEIKDKV